MTELELKFQVPGQSRAGLLKAVGDRRIERMELRARYFDTADRLLARHAMALRLRNENGAWVQTLKASCPHTVERLEHNVELAAADAPDAEVPPPVDPARHADSEPGRRLQKLLRANDAPALVEVCRIDVTRRLRLLKSHGAVVEWSLDEGRIVAGERVQAISELELEFKSGDPQGLYAMAHDWQARHGIWLDVISKGQRGNLLAANRAYADPVKADAPALDRKMDGDAMLRAIVAACLAQILPNASELAGGSEAPEHVHQLRIGLRRLRTALRELDGFLGGDPVDVVDALQVVFDALGEARDQQVLLSTLAPRLAHAGAPLLSPLPPRGGDAHAVAVLVRGAAFQGALLRLLAFAHAPRAADEETPASAADARAPTAFVRERLARLHRQVTRDAGHFDASSLDDQHRVRKRLKRLRYLAEFVAPLFRSRRVDAWLAAVEPAQDALGRHIDHALAAQRFERDAATDPRAWFAVGWLRARLKDTARSGRRRLEKMARADVFW